MSNLQQTPFGLLEELAYAKNFSYKFFKCVLNKEFFSQATQDIFVLQMLMGKTNGFYLEIGAGHPCDSNNTFLLETRYSWKGLAIDIDASLVDVYSATRKNKAILSNALKFDYLKHLSQSQMTDQIDFLSLDVDPADTSYKVLEKLPHDIFRFSVITFEHNRYSEGEKYVNLSRRFLSKLGYELVVSDVKVFGKPFEDWWVDPKAVPKRVFAPFQRQNIEFFDLWWDAALPSNTPTTSKAPQT
jgi:hypothetical protein